MWLDYKKSLDISEKMDVLIRPIYYFTFIPSDPRKLIVSSFMGKLSMRIRSLDPSVYISNYLLNVVKSLVF